MPKAGNVHRIILTFVYKYFSNKWLSKPKHNNKVEVLQYRLNG